MITKTTCLLLSLYLVMGIEGEHQLSPDYQICTFHTEQRTQVGSKKDSPPYREAKYGVVEITGNEIKMHYFFSNKADS